MNKYEAGYNLLMILSVVDGEFLPQEGNVVVDYLREMHDAFVGTANENPMLNELSNDQLISHFRDSSYLFYKQHDAAERKKIFVSSAKDFLGASTEDERKTFIEFVKKVVLADNKISKEESLLMNLLFRTWGLK